MRHVPTLTIALLTPLATAQWHPMSPAQSPPARYQPAMVHDPFRAQTVLFGGARTTPALWNDTWVYDGSNWAELFPTTIPPARAGIEMAFDLGRGKAVLFGGTTSPFTTSSTSNQTWEWDGTDWAQVITAHTPGGRAYYGMAFDELRLRTVLYGGVSQPAFPIAVGGTWEYDGVDWVQVATAQSPGPLQNPAMCWFPPLGRTLLYGGIDPQVGGTTTTWTYDGTNWTASALVPNPGVRTYPRMTFDNRRSVAVLQGGMDPVTGTLFNDTWEFDGATWMQRFDPSPPVARRGPGFAFDAARGTAVYFGGLNQSFAGLTDTFQYGGLVEAFGAGCVGSQGIPALLTNQVPRVGLPFPTALFNLVPTVPVAAFAFGVDSAFAGALPLPADLTFLGLPGCTLYHSVDVLQIDAAAGGVAIDYLTIPAQPQFVGLEFYATGVSLDAVNAFGAVLSPPLRCWIAF